MQDSHKKKQSRGVKHLGSSDSRCGVTIIRFPVPDRRGGRKSTNEKRVSRKKGGGGVVCDVRKKCTGNRAQCKSARVLFKSHKRDAW